MDLVETVAVITVTVLGVFRTGASGIVKLTKSSSIDPQDTGLQPVANPPYWASKTAASLNLTVPCADVLRLIFAKLRSSKG